MLVTSTPLQMDYFIADIATALLTFNRARWYRSRSGAAGTFEAATASTAQPATMRGAVEPHGVSGKTLNLRINGSTLVDVTFSDPDPVSTAQAIAEIEAATALLNGVDDAGVLVLETVATGSGASIEVLGGDAAPYLGLIVNGAAIGLDADTTLSAGVHQYFYTDQNSSEDFWYAVELRNSATPALAPLSVAFPASRVQGVPKTEVVPCFVRLTDPTGYPLNGRRINLVNGYVPNKVQAGNFSWAIFRHSVQMTTNEQGYAETRLLKNLVIDVVVEGTGVIRRIQIPSGVDSVDLLDPTLVVEDEFGIAEPDIDFAIRTS